MAGGWQGAPKRWWGCLGELMRKGARSLAAAWRGRGPDAAREAARLLGFVQQNVWVHVERHRAPHLFERANRR